MPIPSGSRTDLLAGLAASLADAIAANDQAAVLEASAATLSELAGERCLVWTYSSTGRFTPAVCAHPSGAFESVADLAPTRLAVQTEDESPTFLTLPIADERLPEDLRVWLRERGAAGVHVLKLAAHGRTVGTAMVVADSSLEPGALDAGDELAAIAERCASALAITNAEEMLNRVIEELRSSQRQGSAIVAAALDAVITMDLHGRILGWNPQAELTFGWRESEVLDRDLADVIIPPDLRAAHRAGVERYRRTGRGRAMRQRLQLRGLRADGSEFPVELTIAELPGAEGSMFVGFLRDRTDEQAAEAASMGVRPHAAPHTTSGPGGDGHLAGAARSDGGGEGRIGDFAESAPDVIFRYRVRPEFCVEYMSPAVTAVSGHTPEDFRDDPDLVFVICHPSDRHRMQACLRESKIPSAPLTVRWIGTDGVTRWMEHRFTADAIAGDSDLVAGIARDVTDAVRAHQQLAARAVRDPLTGLANRELLLAQMENALAHHKPGRSRTKIALLYCDLDRFKRINDTLGHAAGDEVLVAVAERIRSCIRPSDVFARIGGDEFVLLCDSIDGTADALRMARRIREAMSEPFQIAGSYVQMTCSIGITTTDGAQARSEDLMREADIAMYRAKMAGRDGVELYDRRMRHEVQRRLEDEIRLQDALASGGIEVVYQPIVKQGGIAGFEALARWPGRHGEGAWFVPLAEESGFAGDLGRAVFRSALVQAAAWQEAGYDTVVGVNLGERQFVDHRTAASIGTELEASGCDPERICLEIAESALGDDPGNARGRLVGLGALGVHLALDNFGAGSTGLGHLSRLPFDAVKIDRAFVSGLCDHEPDAAVVVAGRALCRALGLTSVAVGVESETQHRRLLELGCTLTQGFHHSIPVSAAEATVALEQARALESR